MSPKAAFLIASSAIALAACMPMRAHAQESGAALLQQFAQQEPPPASTANDSADDDDAAAQKRNRKRGDDARDTGADDGQQVNQGEERRQRRQERQKGSDDSGAREKPPRDEAKPDRAERQRDNRDGDKRDAAREQLPDPATSQPQAAPTVINRPPQPAQATPPPATASPALPSNAAQDQKEQSGERTRERSGERTGSRTEETRDGQSTEREPNASRDTSDRANRGVDRGAPPQQPPQQPPAAQAPTQTPPPAANAQRPQVTPVQAAPDAQANGRRPRNINDLKNARRERREDGGKRVVIEEPGRVIVKQDNKIVIQQDETARLRRFQPNARVERGRDGISVTTIDRPGRQQVITETDQRGQLVRRYRRDPDGRERNIIDNRRRNDIGRNIAIGAGVVAGAAILNSLVRVPPPRVRIPRDKYIVRYEGASEDDVYEAFNAPPVDRIDRRYTLDQVRATPYLRERMRRVDLDDVTFDFGSWEVNPREYRRLERVARAMNRVIRRNPDEVFLIEGYTDAVGSQIDNLTLSDRRAETVADILTREFDVPFENLATQGYGEDFLKVRTEAPERLNRRVAVRRVTPLIADLGPTPRDDDRRSGRDEDDRYERTRDRYDDERGPPRQYDDRDDEVDDRGDWSPRDDRRY